MSQYIDLYVKYQRRKRMRQEKIKSTSFMHIGLIFIQYNIQINLN